MLLQNRIAKSLQSARATGKSAEAQKINAAVDRIRVDVNRRYQELCSPTAMSPPPG